MLSQPSSFMSAMRQRDLQTLLTLQGRRGVAMTEDKQKSGRPSLETVNQPGELSEGVNVQRCRAVSGLQGDADTRKPSRDRHLPSTVMVLVAWL
jgi:hypothetical protein